MHEHITHIIEQLSRQCGPVVSTRRVREAAGVFGLDAALIEMARQGKVTLFKHDFPASLSDDERDAMVRDVEGNIYNGVTLR